jgi:hypothetical protein
MQFIKMACLTKVMRQHTHLFQKAGLWAVCATPPNSSNMPTVSSFFNTRRMRYRAVKAARQHT